MSLTKIRLMVLVSFTLEPIASLAADTRETEVRKALQSFWHCWETNDAGCMDKLLAEDFDYVIRTGVSKDRADFLRIVREGNLLPNISTPESGPIRFYGPVAFVTFARVTLPKDPVVPFPLDRANAATVPVLPRLMLVWLNPDGKGWRLGRGHVYYQEVLRFVPPQIK
jgi:hypothetical protein